MYCLANSVYNIIHYTPLCKRALALYWTVWSLGWVLFGKIDCFFQASITVHCVFQLKYTVYIIHESQPTLYMRIVELTDCPFCIGDMPETGHFGHFQAFSGTSPMVAKVQGGPQGWVRWVKTRSIIFESFSAMIFKIKIGPIEIPIKNDSKCKKLLTPLNHSDFQKLKCFLK